MLRGNNGYVDVAALDLPRDFLRRAAGRTARLHFRQRFRGVAPDAAPSSPASTAPAAPAGEHDVSGVPRTVVERWRRYPEAVPGLRGFRAPILETGDPHRPTGTVNRAHRQAATYVAQHLARDGLVRTTMRVMREVDLDWVSPPRSGRLDEATLWSVGVPVDLLECFSLDGRRAATVIAAWLDGGADPASIEPTARGARFEFASSRPGFTVWPEDGGEQVGALRFQLPKGGYLRAPGDGSAFDLLLQLLEAIPGCTGWVSLHEDQTAAFLEAIGDLDAAGRISVLPTPIAVTTWAQDNAKVGTVPDGEGTGRVPVTLLPRFASRNESATKFLPGDSFVFRTVGGAIGPIVQSPLAFQGGNLLPFVDPITGRSTLLIGEREIYRNRALGLTVEETLEAFRLEFGVDHCEVVPAVSFHVDMDVTVRRGARGLIACMIDEVAAARIVLDAAMRAMGRGRVITGEDETRVLELLGRGDIVAATTMINDRIDRYRDGEGRLTAGLTGVFASSAAESGSGSAVRFLLAMDILTAHAMSDAQIRDTEPELERYLVSFRRRVADRAALAEQLERLGLTVCRVPGLSDGEAGINYVNGIHTTRAYLMPAFGGLYAPLDAAAAEAFGRALGEVVEVIPVRAAALQMAYGGPHCAASVYPARCN